MNDVAEDRVHLTQEHALHLLKEMIAHSPFRGEVRGALLGRQDPRLPASLHRRGGQCGRRHAGADAGRRDRSHLPRTRPCAGSRSADDRGHGGDVRKGVGFEPRARRLHAHLLRGSAGSMVETPLSPAACRSRSGLALADKMQGRNRVTCCFFGEGAAAEGEFHEVHESRRALAAARALRLREQSLRDGDGARAIGIESRHPRPCGGLRDGLGGG